MAMASSIYSLFCVWTFEVRVEARFSQRAAASPPPPPERARAGDDLISHLSPPRGVSKESALF
jgi:hypothetical protein